MTLSLSSIFRFALVYSLLLLRYVAGYTYNSSLLLALSYARWSFGLDQIEPGHLEGETETNKVRRLRQGLET